VATNLKWIGERARKEPGRVFTSLYHHICDIDNLRACYDDLDGRKAAGWDGVTKEQYGLELEDNLQNLSDRLKRMGYRPGVKRRSYIPKAGSEAHLLENWQSQATAIPDETWPTLEAMFPKPTRKRGLAMR